MKEKKNKLTLARENIIYTKEDNYFSFFHSIFFLIVVLVTRFFFSKEQGSLGGAL